MGARGGRDASGVARGGGAINLPAGVGSREEREKRRRIGESQVTEWSCRWAHDQAWVDSRAGEMVRWGDVENLDFGGLWEEPGEGLVGIREDGEGIHVERMRD